MLGGEQLIRVAEITFRSVLRRRADHQGALRLTPYRRCSVQRTTSCLRYLVRTAMVMMLHGRGGCTACNRQQVVYANVLVLEGAPCDAKTCGSCSNIQSCKAWRTGSQPNALPMAQMGMHAAGLQLASCSS
jgi:hypothetical protein